MVSCKFFLEGFCKFGTRCRFEHIDPYNDNYGTAEVRPFGSSILKSASSGTSLEGRQEYVGQGYSHAASHSFQPTNLAPKTSRYNVQEIMEIVTRDILQSERGNQWQLSCYSPLKELPNIPGLEDHSCEELRYECYKASQDGSIPLWQAIVQQLYANVMKTYNELKRKDSGYTIIDRWLRVAEEKPSHSNVTPSFGTGQMGSVFGNVSTGSVFGGSNASSPFFATSSEQPSVFGGREPTSGFGGKISTSFAGSNSFTFPAFGSSPSVPPAVSPFLVQEANNQSQNDSFSFSLPQSQPTNTQASPGSAFPFGGNTIESQSQPYPFAQPFSKPLTSAVDELEYSKDDELTAEEIAVFKADKFTFGSIPTKPPPRTLCIF